MTNDEIKERKEDPHVKFITERICNNKGKESYVFISYKSDDWKEVLSDIVYRLVKDYGLNVYFDGDFDSHSSSWTEQLKTNMLHYNCKGVLAFLDNQYAQSYATLMEIMCSQSFKTYELDPKFDQNGMPIIPINLGKINKVYGKEGGKDTGLGKSEFNGSTNMNFEKELTAFNDFFQNVLNRDMLSDQSKSAWNPTKKPQEQTLNVAACNNILQDILKKKGINNNPYERNMDLKDIVKKIRNTMGDEVFSNPEIFIAGNDNTVSEAAPAEQTAPQVAEQTAPETDAKSDTESDLQVGVCYQYTGKKYNAYYTVYYVEDEKDGKKLMVNIKKGSTINYINNEEFYNNRFKNKEICSKLNGNSLTVDILGERISTAASIITGRSDSGQALAKNRKVADIDPDTISISAPQTASDDNAQEASQIVTQAAPESDAKSDTETKLKVGSCYNINSDNYNAYYTVYYDEKDGNTLKFTIKKGSKINLSKWTPKGRIDEIRRKLNGDVLTDDISNLPRSTAAKIICGQSTDGKNLEKGKEVNSINPTEITDTGSSTNEPKIAIAPLPR